MKILITIVLVLLVFLAVSSGITKVLLMEQEVDLFSRYGFTSPILIVYGALELLGGVLLAGQKTRLIGAIIVALTFLVSAVVLVLDQNWPVAIVTFVALILLAIVTWQSRPEGQM